MSKAEPSTVKEGLAGFIMRTLSILNTKGATKKTREKLFPINDFAAEKNDAKHGEFLNEKSGKSKNKLKKRKNPKIIIKKKRKNPIIIIINKKAENRVSAEESHPYQQTKAVNFEPRRAIASPTPPAHAMFHSPQNIINNLQLSLRVRCRQSETKINNKSR
jgi:hypothetical protein